MSKTSTVRSRAFLAAIGAGLAIMLAACSGGGTPSGPESTPGGTSTEPTAPPTGGTLTVASPYPTESLDPHGPLGAGTGTFVATMNIFSRLLSISSDGELTPDLAETWEPNENATEWTFTLREASFSDGTPVTSADVVGSFDRVMTLAGPVAGNYKGVTATAPDDQTVVFTSETPEAALPGKLTLFFVTKGDVTDADFTEPIGSGPFVVDSFSPGEELTLSPNEGYYGDVPVLDELVYRVIPEVSSRLAALQAGEIQATWGIPDDQLATLEAVDGLTTEMIPATSVITMWFNSGRDTLASAEVRRALWKGVDFATIISALYPRTGQPADSVVAPAILGYAPQEAYEYDPDAAKAELEAAGFDFGQKLELQFSGAEYRQFIQSVASDLAKIGVDVEPVEKESAVFTQDLLALNWDVNFQALSTPTYDAATNVGRLYTCAANRNGYCNPALDELLTEAGTSGDPEVRKAAYADAIEIIWDDAVGMYPMFLQIAYAWADNVAGIGLSGSFAPDFTHATVS
jgi:peptide/nickel transport system substrate-binding protein